jgi:hypothetical protein
VLEGFLVPDLLYTLALRSGVGWWLRGTFCCPLLVGLPKSIGLFPLSPLRFSSIVSGVLL